MVSYKLGRKAKDIIALSLVCIFISGLVITFTIDRTLGIGVCIACVLLIGLAVTLTE